MTGPLSGGRFHGYSEILNPGRGEKSSAEESTLSSDRAIAASLRSNQEFKESIDRDLRPDTGGIFASATHISNSGAQLARTVVSGGIRITGEHILTTGLILNGSICRDFLAIAQEYSKKGDKVDLPHKGTSAIHEIPTLSAHFRSLLGSIYALQGATSDSDLNKIFGENVSSAYGWIVIPWASGLLLLTACEALFHAVETGSLSTGAIVEFEPFCEAACKILVDCCQEAKSHCHLSYERMRDMISDQAKSKEEALLRKPSMQTSLGNNQTRHATHSSYATTLFSIPLGLSKLVTLLQETKSLDVATLATKRSSAICQEVAEVEKQPQGWPEPLSLGRFSSFFNTLRELIHKLHEEDLHLENQRQKTIAQSVLQSSAISASLSSVVGELLAMRSILARITEVPRMANQSKEFSKLALLGDHPLEATRLRQTIGIRESRPGTSHTRDTEDESREGIRRAELVTHHDQKEKMDFGLVSADSELATTGQSATTVSRAALTTAAIVESTNNGLSETLYTTFQKVTEAPRTLTKEPFKEMVAIVKEVCENQNRLEYSTLSNGMSKLTAQLEEIQIVLAARSKNEKCVNSTYSGTTAVSLEPTLLASLPIRTLIDLSKEIEAIQKAFSHCFTELREQTALQSEETKARTNIQETLISNVTETLSQSLAHTLDVSQKELAIAGENSGRAHLMNHEVTLSEIEKSVSMACSRASQILTLLTNNSGHTLRDAHRTKQEGNLATFESEHCLGEGISEIIEHPDEKGCCKNEDSTGLGATVNTSSFASVSVSGSLLKIFETVHLLGSTVSESLLQALIFSTHPLDQTLATILDWQDRVWMKESHPIEGESNSIFTDQQNRVTTEVARLARNIVSSFSIFMGSSDRKERPIIPAAKALQNILQAFGEDDRDLDEKDQSKILTTMQKMTLKREEIMHDEIAAMLKNKTGRRPIQPDDIATMRRTKLWIETLQNRNDSREEKFPLFERQLEDHLLHIITMAEGRRSADIGVRRELTKREIIAIRDQLLLNNQPRPPTYDESQSPS